MMFFVPPERRMRLLRELARFPGQVMNFHFTGDGAQSWALAG
jgi:D-glycero-alpha-D-manno-heptose-7-phosphate kinase